MIKFLKKIWKALLESVSKGGGNCECGKEPGDKYGVSIGPVEGLTWVRLRHPKNCVGVDSNGKEMNHKECVDLLEKGLK